MLEPKSKLLSIEEYLRLEQDGPVRHEYAGGHIFAMSGASNPHNRLTRNLSGLVWQATRRGPCESYVSDMKVRIGPVFYYPDVFVTCDPRDVQLYYTEHPCLIFEVLSPSTEKVDRGEKFYNYRKIEELQAYVLVHQDRRRLEVYRRAEGGFWVLETLEEKAVLSLEQPRLSLDLDEIYEGLELA